MPVICHCCGQPIRAKRAARSAPSFRGYDDFTPAFTVARRAVRAEFGERWYLIAGLSTWARLPAAWVRCPVFGRVSVSPRDVRIPAARYWPAGELPVGPEYAAPPAPAPAQLAEAAD